MRYVILLVLGAALGISGWWLIAHWGAFAWWTWLAIGAVFGGIVGAGGMYVAVNVAYSNAIGRGFGW